MLVIDMQSMKLTDTEKLKASGLDGPTLAKQVVDIFLTQLLRSGVLHCDPHPGNMCVDAKGRLVFYDFGMVDTLEPKVQQGLRNAAFALFGAYVISSKRTFIKGLRAVGRVSGWHDAGAVEPIVS
jgi:predicted unusual protein kinase regulating ubiquinone biosynthesis (AarF/ABC1/UbiB family)